MSRRPDTSVDLAEPDLALKGLLDSLLAEVPEFDPTTDQPKQQTTVKEPPAPPITQAVVDTATTAEVSASAVEKPPEKAPLLVARAQAQPVLGRPRWADEPQQCLLFDVQGLELAVPLILLDSIARFDGELLPLPSQPDWYLGVVRHRDHKVILLDTPRILMPERVSGTRTERAARDWGYYLVLDGGRWALAVDGLADTTRIEPQQVRWRDDRSKRSWAAGTLCERLCLLLDTERLLQEITP